MNKRENYIKEIARGVESGRFPSYHEESWSLFKGTVDGLGKQDLTAPGWTMVLKDSMGSTQVRTIDIDTVVYDLANQEERWPEIQKQAKAIGEYLSSDRGRWGIGS